MTVYYARDWRSLRDALAIHRDEVAELSRMPLDWKIPVVDMLDAITEPRDVSFDSARLVLEEYARGERSSRSDDRHTQAAWEYIDRMLVAIERSTERKLRS